MTESENQLQGEEDEVPEEAVVEEEEILGADLLPEAETTDDENPEQADVPKKFETNRTSVEEIREADGMGRAISLLKRSKAAEVKEMIRDEYPEANLDSEAIMNMTKKELLDWLKDFYTD